MYHYSPFELVGGLLGIVIAIVATYRYRNEFNSYSIVLGLVIMGGIAVILASIFNSIGSHRWDMEFIIAFLQLRKAGSWLPRAFAFMGYIFIIWGITILIMLRKGSAK